MFNRFAFISLIFFLLLTTIPSRAVEEPDSLYDSLDEIVVTERRGVRKLCGATNTELISASELRRAACCNLGESFTTNPSVDVSYSDAATGARQIRLLGLSGSYVQMLTENVPAFRGVASLYGLGYVPGPWMQSIQVSKGASSVKNGFESITGQINIEMKKPQADPSLSLNAYYDSMNKIEANADGNLHLGRNWNAGLLTHFENSFSAHDGNGDGFVDMPRVRQISAMPRVAYLGSQYVFQAAVKLLDERRRSGQDASHVAHRQHPLYTIGIDTRRIEAFTKNAFMFDRDNDGNIALIASAAFHDQDASYGLRVCDIDQREAYASLMFERKWSDIHALSTGLSFSYDYLGYGTRFTPRADLPLSRSVDREAVGGAYAQYTLNLDDRLVAMGGIRYDYSDRYGSALTPRMHLRYNPISDLSFHASAGRGFRSPHPLAEYSYLLASSRRIEIASHLSRESAWNLGAGGTWTIYPAGRKLGISAEYYYTRFSRQLTADLDSDPHAVIISTAGQHSYSHAVQAELTFEPVSDLSLSAAWRFTDVKVNYGYGLVEKPLISRHKALFTAGYTPRMGLWQFDITCAVNGAGSMPTPYTLPGGSLSWRPRFKAYPTLNAQITRNFRHWAVYLGGENLTAYRQPDPIIGAADPWGSDFDATMVYGPLHGAMVYVGFRYNITKYI